LNNLPIVAPALDKDPVPTDSTLTCTANGTDGDGDNLTFAYEWVESSGAVFATDTGTESTIDIATYLNSDLSEGETVTCRATANDGYQDGLSVEASVAINHQPTVTPTLDNTPVPTEGTVTCSPNGADGDGHNLSCSYEWVDGADVVFATDAGDTSTIDIPTYLGNGLAEGETVTCHVVANDGYEDGPTGEVSAQVKQRPTVSVVLDKDFALTTDSVTCTPTGADDDGHSVQYAYEWTAPSGTFSTEATIDISVWFGQDIFDGDTLTCTVTPNDGLEDGAVGLPGNHFSDRLGDRTSGQSGLWFLFQPRPSHNQIDFHSRQFMKQGHDGPRPHKLSGNFGISVNQARTFQSFH
ncbi:MAG: hypothetical protein HN348_12420, partial [Proteobacteria bacterium]|nr:hypothetical protein [Pseudomonadota bacterium]